MRNYIVAVLVGLVASCGGGSTPTAPSSSQGSQTITKAFSNLPESPTGVLQQIQGSSFPTGALFNFVFEVSAISSVGVVVSWSPDSADVDAALVQGDCVTETCETRYPVARTVSVFNPERLSAALTPGTYTMLVENLGDGPVQGLVNEHPRRMDQPFPMTQYVFHQFEAPPDFGWGTRSHLCQ